MGFLRVVEVFPPVFNARGRGGPGFAEAVDLWTREVGGVTRMADIFLVANLKKPELLKLSTLESSLLLQERLGVEASPVIVVRDLNRPQFLSSVLTGVSLGLKSMMIAWGDDYPGDAKATNVRDFAGLAEAVGEASRIRRRAGAGVRILAPVDLDSLAHPKGVSLARARLRAGADLLLAQPPTTDSQGTFDRHLSLIQRAGLDDRVLLNVFPFRSTKDVRACEEYFGWSLPKPLLKVASLGEARLTLAARDVVRRLRKEGLPGVYLSTRGRPRTVERLLA